MSKNFSKKDAENLIQSYSKIRNASARILNEKEITSQKNKYIISKDALSELEEALNLFKNLPQNIQNHIKDLNMKEHEEKKNHNPFLKEILESFPSSNDHYQKMRIVDDSNGLLSMEEASEEMHLSKQEIEDLLEEKFLLSVSVKDIKYIPNIFCQRPDKLNELKKFIQNNIKNDSWDLLKFLVTKNEKYKYSKPINILFKEGYQELVNY